MRIRRSTIASLWLPPYNPRSHAETNLAAIARSLKEYGQQKPIVVSNDKSVVAGCGTFLAAKTILKWDTILTVETVLSQHDRRRYAIADNRASDLSEWDPIGISAEIQELLNAVDADLGSAEAAELAESLGFSAQELDELLAAERSVSAPRDEASGEGHIGLERILLLYDAAEHEDMLELLAYFEERFGTDNVSATVKTALEELKKLLASIARSESRHLPG